jgi:hypothetical protein
MSMPVTTRLILHPDRPDGPKEGIHQVPLYAVTSEGGVGAQLPADTMTVMMLALYDLVASQWAFLPDGRAFIACQSSFSEEKYWIERSLLAEAGYQVTTAQIDLEAAEIEKALLATFWQEKRTELLHRKQAVIEHPMIGATRSGVVDVAPGTYPMAGLLEKQLRSDQLTPFSLFILVNDAKVAIVPDTLWGIADESAVEAEQKGLAGKVPAAEVRAAFESAPQPLRGYVPANDWLTDAQMHYVNQEWMGAVCVLRRLPASQQEVTKAAEDEQLLFTEGMTSAGVRFGADIFIQESYRGTGVEYHESVHKLSHRAMRDVLGQMFNEGATEYFTWKVIGDLVSKGLVIRDESQYGPQRHAVTTLIEHGVAETELAEAYFRGRLQPLFDKFAAITKNKLSLDGYAARLGNAKARAAINVLDGVVGT